MNVVGAAAIYEGLVFLAMKCCVDFSYRYERRDSTDARKQPGVDCEQHLIAQIL